MNCYYRFWFFYMGIPIGAEHSANREFKGESGREDDCV